MSCVTRINFRYVARMVLMIRQPILMFKRLMVMDNMSSLSLFGGLVEAVNQMTL